LERISIRPALFFGPEHGYGGEAQDMIGVSNARDEFSEDYGIYGGHNTEVLPISVDQVPSLRAFQRQEHFDVQVLSDARREVSRAYGVLDDTRYNSRRSYFLIDTEGIIRWVHAETQGGAKRDTAELIRQVEALG
jgi:alkyl hydroperoxide reductase subunit AhpC